MTSSYPPATIHPRVADTWLPSKSVDAIRSDNDGAVEVVGALHGPDEPLPKIDDVEFGGRLASLIRAYVRRVHRRGDLEALRKMNDLHAEVDKAVLASVELLRNRHRASWSQIADALRITKAAARQRYAHLDTDEARRPGGQPGELR